MSAAELARVYPPPAAQLADLLGRLRASDDRIEYMNAHALPRGCGPLLVAELVARELDGFVRDSVDIPRIVRRVQLPAFEYDAHHLYVRPRSSSVDAGSLMFRAPFANWVRALPERRRVACPRCPSTARNAPSKTEAALTAALVDQAGTTVKPGKQESLDIDDTRSARREYYNGS